MSVEALNSEYLSTICLFLVPLNFWWNRKGTFNMLNQLFGIKIDSQTQAT